MLCSHVLRLATTFRCKQSLILSRKFSLTTTTTTTSWSHNHHHSLILHLCSSLQSLEQTKKVHAFATLHGLLHHSSSICASLMVSYATFRESSVSLLLFQQRSLKHENAFLWNTLIRSYSICALHYEALDVYNRMVRNGVRPDDHTFPFVLKVCSDASAIEKGREIHGSIFKLGFNDDVFVGNTLLNLYATESLSDTHQMFEEMPERDIVTWNSVIVAFSVNGYFSDALECFLKLNSTSGLKPNSISVVSVLPLCAELQDGVFTREIHGYVVKTGLDSQVNICNSLVDVYGKCGDLEASKLVFDKMLHRNVISWNALIAAYAHRGIDRNALDMFRSMVTSNEKPDSTTISTVLPVLVELEVFNLGREVHGYSIRMGMDFDVYVSNSLIDMYAKSGRSKEASNIFYEKTSRNVVTWNAMVANFAQNRFELEAVKLVEEMQLHGECPNSITITNVLPACARMGFLRQGKEIHGMSVRKGLAFDLFVTNALVDLYAKCGCLHLAKNLFDTSIKDQVSYNILIVGYSVSQHCLESLHLFSEMGRIGLKHDTVSFIGVLAACANLNKIKQGKEIHGVLVRRLFHSHLFVANSLLDLYTKCGRIDLAKRVFDQIPDKDVASWNTMILGYGMQGEFSVAVELFDKMRGGLVEYDSVSYIAVLTACSHGGMVERGIAYFNDMVSRDIKPTQLHYACMVDLLGRAGMMEEAVRHIRDMPIEPDENVWGAMLGACRVYGNIELGRWAAEHLFELKPDHCGYYILLSNMYAEAGNWDEVNRIRELMKSKGVKKNAGCSWVQIQKPESMSRNLQV